MFTRGGGAYAYTYTGPVGLQRGQLCSLSFRRQLELGVVLGVDGAPPAGELLPLLPVAVVGHPRWGALLLTLAELCCCAPDEVAGHLLLAPPRQGFKLRLALAEPEAATAEERALLGRLAGRLTPKAARELLAGLAWPRLCELAAAGTATLAVDLTGLPGVTRAHHAWRRWYAPDSATARLLGLSEEARAWPGAYLAGLRETLDYSKWPTAAAEHQAGAAEEDEDVARDEDAQAGRATAPAVPSKLAWEPLAWDGAWDIARRLPGVNEIKVRRAQADWQVLRGEAGLAAELGQAVAAGQRVLVLAPQHWLLDRVWPHFAPWAERMLRYHASAGPGMCAWILEQLIKPGRIVAGGTGAWKLAAYGGFDRVILLDPSHPQYAPDRAPYLDPRTALLAALAGQGGAALDIIELGLSAWDGKCNLDSLQLWESFTSPPPPVPGAKRVDTDPLPLKLREPGVRRLVYFNRLGSTRGVKCVECEAQVGCPRCASLALRFSAARQAYACGACGWQGRDLRCARCGMAALASLSPGLEAVTRRPSDLLVSGAAPARVHPETNSVIGTAHLLEPLAEFWPQEVVYFHAEDRRGAVDDWPVAADMVARLRALYANPALTAAHLVSTRLAGQLGARLTGAQIAEQWDLEFKLRKLAALPPYECLYHFAILGQTLHVAALARELVGKTLQHTPGTALLRLGKPYGEGAQYRVAGMFINGQLSYESLQRLRWQVFGQGAFLGLQPVRGPWL
jgi:hypothetical protein